MGKTHLLHAIANSFQHKEARLNIFFLTAESFFRLMIKIIQKKSLQSLREVLGQADLIMIDDIQFISNKGKTQEEFFHLFNFMMDKMKPCVFTSDRYPREIAGIEERINTR